MFELNHTQIQKLSGLHSVMDYVFIGILKWRDKQDPLE